MKIYLVVGHTGEYSDHTQWNVAAYPEREAAEMHLAKLKEEVARTKALPYATKESEDFRSSLDPELTYWRSDCEYFVEEVLLVRHVDEYLEQVTTAAKPE